MSLEVDGIWAGGVWASTVWADDVWREGDAPEFPPGSEAGTWLKRNISIIFGQPHLTINKYNK
jgi:hypothetical protein